MADNSKEDSILTRLRKEYKLIVLDEASMVQKRTIRFTGMKAIGIAALSILIIGFLTAVLTTQTGILRYLGPRPRVILGNDYIAIKNQMDSLQKLTESREEKFRTIEKFLTERVSSEKEDRPDTDEGLTEYDEPAEHDNRSAGTATELLLPLMRFEKPLDGEVTGEYDAEKFHYGIDLAARSNTRIKAVADGMVVINGYSHEDGHVLMIRHANGYISWYKHNSHNLVMPGRQVIKGQPIAIIGNTGENSSGPHLHFELWRDDIPLNPRDFLKY